MFAAQILVRLCARGGRKHRSGTSKSAARLGHAYKLRPVDGDAARAVALDKVAALNHKLLHDAVEQTAFVALGHRRDAARELARAQLRCVRAHTSGAESEHARSGAHLTWRKFSAVLGTWWANNSITMRPMGVVFISQSKKTSGLSGCSFCLCSCSDEAPDCVAMLTSGHPTAA